MGCKINGPIWFHDGRAMGEGVGLVRSLKDDGEEGVESDQWVVWGRSKGGHQRQQRVIIMDVESTRQLVVTQ